MLPDVLPAPYGDVTRRWTQLDPETRDTEAVRLVGVPLAAARVDSPDPSCHEQYLTVADAAVAGDEVAFGWLATSHRPVLLSSGRILFEHDPAEWGANSLELLYTALARSNRAAGPWLRRQVTLHLRGRMARLTRTHLARRGLERPIDPARLYGSGMDRVEPLRDPHPDLTIALERAVARFEPSTRDGLRAVATHEPLAAVAAAHQLSEPALRQRISRARRQMQPELTAFRRSA